MRMNRLGRYKGLFVGLSVALADAVWVVYIRTIAENQHLTAAFVSVILILLGAFVTIAYVSDRRMLVPAAIGAFLGTLISSILF